MLFPGTLKDEPFKDTNLPKIARDRDGIAYRARTTISTRFGKESTVEISSDRCTVSRANVTTEMSPRAIRNPFRRTRSRPSTGANYSETNPTETSEDDDSTGTRSTRDSRVYFPGKEFQSRAPVFLSPRTLKDASNAEKTRPRLRAERKTKNFEIYERISGKEFTRSMIAFLGERPDENHPSPLGICAQMEHSVQFAMHSLR